MIASLENEKVILFGFNWVVKLLTFTSFMHLCTFVPLPSSKSSQEVLIWLSKERALASCHGARSTAITPNKGALPQESHWFSRSQNLDPHVPYVKYPIISHPSKKIPWQLSGTTWWGSSSSPRRSARPRGGASPGASHNGPAGACRCGGAYLRKKGQLGPSKLPQLTSDQFSWSIIDAPNVVSLVGWIP